MQCARGAPGGVWRGASPPSCWHLGGGIASRLNSAACSLTFSASSPASPPSTAVAPWTRSHLPRPCERHGSMVSPCSPLPAVRSRLSLFAASTIIASNQGNVGYSFWECPTQGSGRHVLAFLGCPGSDPRITAFSRGSP